MRRALAVLLLLAGCAAQVGERVAGPSGPEDTALRQQTHWIPLRQEDGSTILLLGRVCRPAGDAPARLVVIAHGSPPNAAQRPNTTLTRCDSEAVRWFTGRGYVVAVALRRGFGGTGGPFTETAGGCSTAEYVHSAQTAAQDIAAVVAYASALPGVRPGGAVVVGQSAGGWSVLGLNSLPHPGIVAMVSMAGGRGGHVRNVPNNNCQPDHLVQAAGELGRTAGTPMLWVFTANDSYFDPALAQRMHQAFTAAGGAADLHALPAFAADGHTLFFGHGGSPIWGPLMEQYLAARGAGP